MHQPSTQSRPRDADDPRGAAMSDAALGDAALSIDPDLEALLDDALAVQPPAGLADRIVAATQPRLSQSARGAVVGRIGPAAAALAAVLALALGAAMWIAALDGPAGTGAPLGAVESRLAELEALDAARDADIDQQLTLMALQVDLAERADWWASASEEMDRTTLQHQLDVLSGDPAIF